MSDLLAAIGVSGTWLGPLVGSLLIAVLAYITTIRQSRQQWKTHASTEKIEWEKRLDVKTSGFIDRLQADRKDLETRLDTEEALRKADRDLAEARYASHVVELASCRESEGRQYHEIVELRKRIMDLALASTPNGNGAK